MFLGYVLGAMFLGKMETKKREEWNRLQSRAFSMFDATKAEHLALKNGAVACVYPTCGVHTSNRAYGVLRLVQRVFQTAPRDSQFLCRFYRECRLA